MGHLHRGQLIKTFASDQNFPTPKQQAAAVLRRRYFLQFSGITAKMRGAVQPTSAKGDLLCCFHVTVPGIKPASLAPLNIGGQNLSCKGNLPHLVGGIVPVAFFPAEIAGYLCLVLVAFFSPVPGRNREQNQQ
jgi:hypothetical protein